MERDLCLWCDEKDSPEHVCRNRRLPLILLTASEDEEDNRKRKGAEGGESEEDDGESEEDDSAPKLMKLKGRLKHTEVIVLIGSGASENFISSELVKRLKIPTERTERFDVMLGGGHGVSIESLCRGLELQLQGITVSQDFYPSKLGSADVVLGFPWLSSLGQVYSNFKDLTMSFEWNGEIVELKGDPSLTKTLKEEGQGKVISMEYWGMQAVHSEV